MKADSVPRQVDEYQLEDLDGELLLYHAGKTETLYVNDTAAVVWHLCDGQRTVEEIVEILAESYPDAADRIPADVEEILDGLVKRGCVEFADEQPASGETAESSTPAAGAD